MRRPDMPRRLDLGAIFARSSLRATVLVAILATAIAGVSAAAGGIMTSTSTPADMATASTGATPGEASPAVAPAQPASDAPTATVEPSSSAAAAVAQSPSSAPESASASASASPSDLPSPSASPAPSPNAAGSGDVVEPPAAADAANPIESEIPTQPGDFGFKVRGGGGPRNVVQVTNRSDGAYRGRGSVDYNVIKGDTVKPLNVARAEASCTGCTTFAIALQIDLYKRGSHTVAPGNFAVALNVNCHSCVTVAWALQYVIPVDDPRQVPGRVKKLAHDMDKELRAVMRDPRLPVVDRINRINAVITRFDDLGKYLLNRRDSDASTDSRPGKGAAAPTPGPSDAAGDAPLESPAPSGSSSAAPSTPAEATPTASSGSAQASASPAGDNGSGGSPAPASPSDTPAPATLTNASPGVDGSGGTSASP